MKWVKGLRVKHIWQKVTGLNFLTNEEIKQFYAHGLFPCLQKTSEKNSGFVFRGCRKSKTIENEITNDKIFVVRLLQKALHYDAEN